MKRLGGMDARCEGVKRDGWCVKRLGGMDARCEGVKRDGWCVKRLMLYRRDGV